MVVLQPHILDELLAAIDEAVETLSNTCEDCDHDGSCSYSRGRLQSIRNVIAAQPQAAA